MAQHANSHGIALRPHAKTHKIPDLAKMQLRNGAVGITVATVGEAEIFAKAGIKDIFIAYPLFASREKLRRLKKLNRKIRLSVGIDSVAGAKSLQGMSGLDVMVEIDSGHHRSGCEPKVAGLIALEAMRLGLNPKGVFTFPGHSYSPGAMGRAVKDEGIALKTAVLEFKKVGIEAMVVSSGSTPTALLTGARTKSGIVNELRPGVYIFNDAQQWELGTCSKNDIALFAEATVVSVSGNKLILDSGSKVLGSDRPSWTSGYGRLLDYPEAVISAISEHHATVIIPDKQQLGKRSSRLGNTPEVGDRLRVVPNHVCTAVNLADEVYLVRDREIIGKYKVAARGKNS